MTFFVYIRLAVNVRHTVTVASSPSGTCVARRRRDTTATLSGGRIDGVEAVRFRGDAIAATAVRNGSKSQKKPRSWT